MRLSLKKLYSACSNKIKSSFILESVIGSIVGIISISLFFALLSHICPKWYRELTKWANRPLLPVATLCKFECSSHSPIILNQKSFSVCKVTLMFDVPLKSNETLLIYDPKEKIIINDLNDFGIRFTNKFYNFFGPTGNSKISFIAIGDSKSFGDKVVSFEDCPFKVSIFGE